jgi:hypothetical protein
MRTIKKIFCIALMLIVYTSCKKDFLERAPGVNLSLDKVFLDPVLASNFGDASYSFRINDYHRWGASSTRTGTIHLSDEAIAGGDATGSVTPFYTALYHTTENDIGTVWNNNYSGIRNINIMLFKMDQVPWTAAQDPKRIKGEQYFLRAFYYADLLKRFGAVPIIDKVYTIEEDIDLPRSTYDQCVAYILADLDKAESMLPIDYTATSGPNTSANYGRATVGSAKALRSRVLLYAASPRDNPTNDLTKWANAAAAAKAVMDMQVYSLMPNYAQMLNLPNSPEYIQIKIRGPRGRIFTYLQDAILSPGSGGDQCSNDPTQNHVDLYEMANGKAITDPASGYNPQQPYIGRDPRFYANILYNDVPWEGRRMQMYDGGTDYKDGNVTYSLTRYYNRKYWPEQIYAGSNATALVNYIYFRYGEILLNYAEAQNEVAGPDPTVYDAINQIRTRAGMPGLPANLTQTEMRERIINERAIELAFEDQRWFDIMRLKIGPKVVAAPMKGMNVVKNANGTFTYNVVTMGTAFQKIFTHVQNFYPIPRREIQKSKGKLIQNPGWE